MKLATLRTDRRDGELIVCSRDLARAVSAKSIAATLQTALDDWAVAAPHLAALARDLEQNRASGAFALDLTRLMAPLPRTFGWIDSSVYLNHMELARRLRGVEMPDVFRVEPLLSPRIPAPFLGPFDPLPLPPGDVGLDIEGEIAVILGDVPYAVSAQDVARHIALITLVNDTSLRSVYARDLARGKTAYHGKGTPAMAPVAVTPDELGEAWDGGKINLALECRVNGGLLGRPHAGVDMQFEFPEIIASAVSLRGLPAGTVLASGTVSNRDRSVGSACIAEARMIETIAHGAPRTPYLSSGDAIRIEMFDQTGASIFGPIAQTVEAAA
jgi:fumarylacetoacetate (FAA) hydrolase